MLLALNTKLVGKPTPDTVRVFNHAFSPVDLSVSELAEQISLGYAFCPQFKNGRRQSANFKTAGYLAVDIDHGLDIESAQGSDFYQNYASLLYTTASHSAQAHRFRVVFELESTIDDPERMKAALTGLIAKFGGDQSCNDACRIFFGSVSCELHLHNKKLPADIVEELIVRGRESVVRTDNRNDKYAPQVTVASRIQLSANTQLLTEAGQWALLKDLPAKTRVHCPQHIDNRPSAFTLRSQRGVPGVHCKSCNATFFLGEQGSATPYRYDFDYSWKRVLGLSYDEYSAYSDDNGHVDVSEVRGGRIRVSSVQYLPFDESSIVKPPEFPPILQSDLDASAEGESASPLWDITFVKSPKGSGKTEWLKHLVEMHKAAGNRVLLIGHRRTLINSTAHRLGLTSYLNTPVPLQTAKSRSYAELVEMDDGVTLADLLPQPQTIDVAEVIGSYNKPTSLYAICLDSLPARLDPRQDKYDLIIIDEVEQVFAHLLSRTLKPARREVLIHLKHYLKAAKALYLLDADLNRVTVEVVDALLDDDRERRWQALINLPEPEVRVLHFYETARKDVLTGELAAALLRGERCFVATNSRSWTENLAQQLEKACGQAIKSIVVSSHNSHTPEIQRFIRDIKTEALNYQLIITSPSMGTGIDITFDGGQQLIDTVFGFFETRINTHFDIDQQLCRVRNPKRINVWIAPDTYSFECDPAVIESEIAIMQDEFEQLIDISPDGEKVFRKKDAVENLYGAIYASVSASRRASMNDLRRNFVKLRESSGWSIIAEKGSAELASEGEAIQQARKAVALAARYQRILSAKHLSMDDFARLKGKKDESLSEAERDAMERWDIESFYYRDVSLELLEEDNNWTLRHSVLTYQLLTSPDEVLTQRDQDEDADLFLDRHKRLMKKNLLVELFSAAGIFTDGVFDTEVEISGSVLQRFADTCVANKSRIEELLKIDVRADVRKKSVQQLTASLKLLGLSLSRSRIEQAKGKKRYFYRLDQGSLEQVKNWAAHNADPELRAVWYESRRDDDDIAVQIEALRKRAADKKKSTS